MNDTTPDRERHPAFLPVLASADQLRLTVLIGHLHPQARTPERLRRGLNLSPRRLTLLAAGAVRAGLIGPDFTLTPAGQIVVQTENDAEAALNARHRRPPAPVEATIVPAEGVAA